MSDEHVESDATEPWLTEADVPNVTHPWLLHWHRGYERAWAVIAEKYGDTVCAFEGECWEYMGSANGVHTFRHRDLCGEGRVYEHVPVEADDYEAA